MGLSPAAVGSEVLEKATERLRAGAHQQQERLQARGRALRYAEQTDGLVAVVQFADGPVRWTVFKAGEAIAAFPAYDGDLHEALKHHVIEHLTLRAPAEIQEAGDNSAQDALRPRFAKADPEAADQLPDEEIECGGDEASAPDDAPSPPEA